MSNRIKDLEDQLLEIPNSEFSDMANRHIAALLTFRIDILRAGRANLFPK